MRQTAENEAVGPLLPKLCATLVALSLAGDGIVDDGEQTTLPISPTGDLGVLPPEHESLYAFTDAGLLWAPAAEETAVQNLADAGAPDAGPPAALQGPCAPIAERIAHRHAYLRAVEQKGNEVGLDKAAQAYCELHPTEVECARPPAVVEQNLSDLIVDDPTGPPPEHDAWVVRWKRELAQCQARPPETSRARGRK